MALRARKPEAVQKRLKLFMFGPAGVGKTTAAIQFPNSYIIDCERGTENYDKLITAGKSVMYQTTDVHDVIAHVVQEIVPPAQHTPQALAAHHRAEMDKWLPMIKAASAER